MPSLRFLRGLVLGLSLSVLNLVGMFMMLLLLGGIGEWSGGQFIGIFGLFEVGTGAAFLFCPNVWRLPPIEADLDRDEPAQLTVSTVFIPHWAAGAKAMAGVAMVIYAGIEEGFVAGSVGLLPFAFFVGVGTVAISAAGAAWGTKHLGRDVVEIVIRRPTHKDLALPKMSIVASTLQVLLGMFTLPTIKLLSPTLFFQPEFAPTVATHAVTTVLATLSVLLMLYLWRGRLRWRAAPAQQALAEQPA